MTINQRQFWAMSHVLVCWADKIYAPLLIFMLLARNSENWWV